MLVLTKYGPVEINVGDKFTCNEYNWTVVSISDPAKDNVDGMYQDFVPVVIVHDPTQQDLSNHEAHGIVTRPGLACHLPGLACHLLDELNVRSFICGQWGAYSGEAAAARLHEQRNSLLYDHVPNYHAHEQIALDSTIDHDLALEGMAREISHSIQNARKKAKLKAEDNIVLAWESDSAFVKETFDLLGRYIYDHTQSTLGDPGDAPVVEIKLDHLGVKHDLKVRFKLTDL